DSHPGVGSRFYFTLPVADIAAIPAKSIYEENEPNFTAPELAAAPDYTVNAWNDASVIVWGNVVSTDEDALAVSSSGADVHIQGGVTSTGEGGTGINASAWDLVDPAVGANVTVDGKISADTPLRIESLPVEESEHTEKTTKEGYRTVPSSARR
ncbi:MAG: hypothetical protein PHT62_07855, partial [Desulfotomaculaceae bacterium]|nr:hypothetical protein [Desulfotomaculaceae bacterium]